MFEVFGRYFVVQNSSNLVWEALNVLIHILHQVQDTQNQKNDISNPKSKRKLFQINSAVVTVFSTHETSEHIAHGKCPTKKTQTMFHIPMFQTMIGMLNGLIDFVSYLTLYG